jgi:repressor LexA
VSLTARQHQILAFVQSKEQPPTAREMAAHFELSVGAVADHIKALRAKGYLAPPERGPRQARGLRVANSFRDHQRGIVHVPLYGSIPAGFADERHQEAEGCVSVDAATLGRRPTQRLFALRVRGDSMVERHILPGDIVVLEHGREARSGDTVAALIDGESTLKVLAQQHGKPFLRAANARYPDLIPASELAIQGVLVAVIRRIAP